MSEADAIVRLTLATMPGISGVKLQQILARVSMTFLAQAGKRELAELGFKPAQINHLMDRGGRCVERCLTWTQQADHHIVHGGEAGYPALLRETATPPPVLFVQGNPEVLNQPQIGVVGSRDASIDGLHLASVFARDLAKEGLVVTSGLALGVDSHAHQACLEQGGETVAVLGSGLEHIYPKQHRRLAEAISQQGALVSEFAPYAPPRAYHFPRRNRIISGLSLGVLVVEATEKSGSLITARLANEQGRDVYAVPGSVLNPNARGCHRLIREGAVLVESAQDIVAEINGLINWSTVEQQPLDLVAREGNEPKEVVLPDSSLLAYLGETPLAVDFLAQKTHLPVNKVMMQLLELELEGLVASVSGGYIRLRGR